MSSTPPPPTLVPGQILDRYELLCPVAQGGMAQVWVARQRGGFGFQKLVAIKTVVSEHAHEERFISAFLDEARIISGIRHPNVAQILDLGQRDEVLYLVLEWIDGDSVAALRRAVHGKSHKLPLNIVLRILADCCAGLHAAHELKNAQGQLLSVVHRDVSPSNVLVSTSGEIKLIDFGVAKAIDRVSKETAAGVIKGKVAYMSPEHALGKPLDRRADIWSCGIMLYHLLAGRTPYEGENQIQTLHRVVQGQPPDPLRGVPAEVAEIAYTALSYDPVGRFASADEMQRAAESALMRCSGPTTQTDVAKYVNEQLTERLTRRKKTIQRALEAAEQRRELHAEFETAIEESSSSIFARELRTPSTLSAHLPSQAASEAIDALIAGAVPPPSSVGAVSSSRKASSRAPASNPRSRPQAPITPVPVHAVDPESKPVPPLQPVFTLQETQPSFPAQRLALPPPPTPPPRAAEPEPALVTPALVPPAPVPPAPMPPAPAHATLVPPGAMPPAPVPPTPGPPPPAPRTPLPPPAMLAPLPALPPVEYRIPQPPAKLPPIPSPPAPPPQVTEPLLRVAESNEDTETTRKRANEPVAIPHEVAISSARDPEPPLIPRMITLSDAKKFGTRRRAPLIVLGFAAALALLAYGVYLAWERFKSEQNSLPSPISTPAR